MAQYVITWKLGKRTIKSQLVLVTVSGIAEAKRKYPSASKIEKRNKRNW